MAEPDDLKALESITNEVDNSQVKFLISSQCLKAQAFLLDKLRKQTERQKEICKFIGSSNLKLETEIQFAEQEIKSLNIAVETIKLGNVELSKEHLLSKERKAEIFERTKIGKKKYENLWLTSKKRYESIPIVQKLVETKNKNEAFKASINSIINESKDMVNDIKIKKNELEATDKARIIELAEFFVRERIKTLTQIKENDVKIKAVLNEIDIFEKEGRKNKRNPSYNQPLPSDQKEAIETTKDSPLDDEWTTLSKNSGIDALVLPKLHLQNNDLDIFSIRLDQINKVDSQNTSLLKRTISSRISDLGENSNKIRKLEENNNENYISSYFDISLNNSARNEEKKLSNKNYSEKKLINILEDIKLDKDETYKIMNKLEVNKFQATKYISSESVEQYQSISKTCDQINRAETDQKTAFSDKDLAEETGEIKSSKVSKEDVVDPPSQFLDISQNQSSQENKAVPLSISIEKEICTPLEEDTDNSKKNKSQEQINISTASGDSYIAIKDKMLKQRNLDLSPQFMYSKPTVTHKLQEDKVTSKFFESQKGATPPDDRMDKVNDKNVNQEQVLKCTDSKSSILENEANTMNASNIVVSSPKRHINSSDVPVAGFLFNHGAQGIPESLNLSISTTGFEDSEDFPHCIDSSLLLSPTANINQTSSHNNEVSSQEVPNFLAGFRRTTLSFFGSTSAEPKPESGEPQSSSFNFAFGKEEKKGRGGFFSMFN